MRASIILLSLVLPVQAWAAGFSEPAAVFYGKVLNRAAGEAQQLYEGQLEIQLGDLTLTADLSPTGAADAYSYSLEVPLKHLPSPEDQALNVRSVAEFYKFQSIKIDGAEATPIDAAEGYRASFESRGEQTRLDLAVSLAAKDSDGDGMPDWWEEAHDLNPAWAGDASLDPDGDMANNLTEFRRGTNPAEDNTAPSILARTLRVPESGRAGFLVGVVDFDSAAADISLKMTDLTAGFELQNGGTTIALDGEFTLAEVENGALVLRHTDPVVKSGSLALEVNDGSSASVTASVTASLPITVFDPGVKATLWLDAAALAGVGDGNRFGAWPDRSQHNNEAWQPSEAGYPRYVDMRRGHPAVSFNGNNRHLLLEEGAVPEGAVSIFTLYEAEDHHEPQQVLATNRAAIQLDAEERQTTSHTSGEVQGSQSLSSRTVLSSVVFDGEGAGDAFTDRRYDGAVGEGASLPPVQAAIGLRRDAQGGTSAPFDGYLHELLVIEGAVDVLQRRRLTDYFASKWQETVVWDWSEETTPIVAQGGPERDILRGGSGDDALNGQGGDDLLSSGPGDDAMLGGPGNDIFAFSKADGGRDTIGDFDPESDVLELSELFADHPGDPRASMKLRVESVRDGETPRVQTILTVFEQEIVFTGLALGETDLEAWMQAGVLRTGAPTSDQPNITFDVVDRFASRIGQAPATVRLTRDGPLNEALSVDLLLEGDALAGVDYAGFPAVATFAPGSDTAVITITPSGTLRGHHAAQSVRIKLVSAPDRYTTRALQGATVHLIDAKVGSPLTYALWRAEKMLTGSNTGPLEDKDNDSIVNVIEYAIGTNPLENASPLGMVVPQEEYVLDERFHVRFKTTAAIIDVNYQLYSFQDGGPVVVADDAFEVQQRLLPSGMIERVFRSRTPASNASGVGLYMLGITLDDQAAALVE